MNIVSILLLVLFILSLTDFLFVNQPKLAQQLYRLSFFVTFFFVSIKYYYGVDIALYIPLYEKVESPMYILKDGDASDGEFGDHLRAPGKWRNDQFAAAVMA